MKLMCTACQQWLQVGDEFAGQRMKCPLCNNVFTVPALPPEPDVPMPPPLAPPIAPPLPQNPSESPPMSAGGLTPMFTGNQDVPSGSSTTGGSEVYKVVDDPKPMTPPAAPQTSVPPPLSPPPKAAIKPGPAPAPTLQGYTQAAGFSIQPQILQWIPIGCLGIVFVLQLFAWTKFAPGGEEIVSQNAWQAAFGGASIDPDLKEAAGVLKNEKSPDKVDVSASVMTIFYLLSFFPVLFIVAAIAVYPMIGEQLPPQIQQSLKTVLPWRWAVCAGAAAIPFFFLGLQSVAGFAIQDQVDTNIKATLKKDLGDYDSLPTARKKEYDMAYGMAKGSVYQTLWVKLALVLHVVALAAAGLMFWYSQRGDHRPLPRVELKW